MIKPFFHSLCEKYGDVVFIEIDVDDAQDVASHCDVKCMPTFQFYKNGKKVGSDFLELEQASYTLERKLSVGLLSLLSLDYVSMTPLALRHS
ncbi:hypothetical protein Nmel_007681 [Mimus melanotis]